MIIAYVPLPRIYPEWKAKKQHKECHVNCIPLWVTFAVKHANLCHQALLIVLRWICYTFNICIPRAISNPWRRIRISKKEHHPKPSMKLKSGIETSYFSNLFLSFFILYLLFHSNSWPEIWNLVICWKINLPKTLMKWFEM